MRPTALASSCLLTPAGAGAIAVIRVLGPQAGEVLQRVFRPHLQVGTPDVGTGRLCYGALVDGDERIDDVIVGPAVNQEDGGFDISAHGGVRVVERILEALRVHGAPLREDVEVPLSIWPQPNRIAAEAVSAMTRARTDRAVRFLAWQRLKLPGAMKGLAEQCALHRDEVETALLRMIKESAGARVLIEGATVALMGPPNSGKSTLFNRLLGRAAVVVSSQAGTTRDWVSAEITIAGIPVTLIDTAGAGSTADALERQAILAGQTIAAGADARILVFDGADPAERFEAEPWRTDAGWGRTIIAINKVDRDDARPDAVACAGRVDLPMCRISALTGAGAEELTRQLVQAFGLDGWSDDECCFFSGRQIDVAKRALSVLHGDAAAAAAMVREELAGL